MTCPCSYPLIIKYDDIISITLPLDEFETRDIIEIPEITTAWKKGKKWIKVQWNKDIHNKLKEYNVAEHIVIAGCDKNEITCNTKSIYEVYHPIEEWEKYHIIDIDKLKENKK